MTDIFLKIVNMSISASWIVLAVLLLRLLLKKAPKWITVLLWGIVAIRLICPFSIESVMSLIPSAETISKAPDAPRPHFESGVTVVDNQVNDYLQGYYFEGVTKPEGHFVDIASVFAIVWLIGAVALLIYTIISYQRIKNKIGTAVLLRDNIYQSETVTSPFVLGIIMPKIYLPFNISEQDMEHVIAHEQAHISRKDHLWKPFGFLLLTLHWFNPLMWLGYALLCRDIEIACDEKAIKELNAEQKADYSQALLTCSVNRRMISACPLAFGEVGVKGRVKSVLSYKKPAFWIILVAIIASVMTAICFLTNPVTPDETESDMLLDVLNNEKSFINESGETVYLKGHKPFNLANAIPERYALVDFDADGEKELVIYIKSDVGAYTVFHIYNDKVYGFDFTEREMIFLKEDGTFVQSSGAGVNSFVTLRFEKDKCNTVEQAYLDDTKYVYRVNGTLSTVEAVNEYSAEFYNKSDAVWEMCKLVFKLSNKVYKNLEITVTFDYENQVATDLTVFDKKTDKKIQEIKFKDNTIFSDKIVYIKDVSFDGEYDLVIPYQRSASGVYCTAYVWDSATKQFVYAPSFEKLPNVALDNNKKEILSYKSADKSTLYSISIFNTKTKDFEVQRTFCYYLDGGTMVYEETLLRNGTLEQIASFSKLIEGSDYYLMDPEIYDYYSNHAEWDLDSTKWNNYLVS